MIPPVSLRGKERDVGMFDKLVQKGKKMAVDYAKEQMSGRKGQQRSGDGYRGNSGYGQDNGYRGNSGYGQDNGYRGNSGYGQDNGYAQPYPSAGGQHNGQQPGGRRPVQGAGQGTNADREAIAKYQYMLRTAPPEDMERAHAEAFGRLSPQQRTMLQDELNNQLPASERPRSDAPNDLARSATRAEMSRPGFMEKILGSGSKGGPGRGAGVGLAAGAAGGLGLGLLAGVAGGFAASAIAGPLLDGFSGLGDGITGAAEGLGDGITGATEGLGDGVTAAGEGLTDQAGGLFDGLLGGGEGPTDWL